MSFNIQLPPGGILMGIGTDIIEISRIKSVMLNHGERFVNRILTDEERAYCMSMAHPDKHIAARFAAKEAVSKCFTTGIGSELGWKSVSVYHGTRHEPLVRLDQQGQALLKHVGATHILLTLSHTDNYAMAVAALVRS
jgi:holo-[acyl-carrier protein] synthase